jgi:hypothetical protein
VLKRVLVLTLILLSFTLDGCKPTYEAPVDAPETSVRSKKDPYEIDFVQINNNVIDTFQDDYYQKTFPYIKNLEINGDNQSMTCTLNLEVINNVSGDAIIALLTSLTLDIGEEAQMQDFRLKKSDNESFGTVFDIYNYTIKVTQDSNTIYDQTIETTDGEDIPFNPSTDGDTIKESIEAEIASNNADAVQETVATKETAASETTAQAAG